MEYEYDGFTYQMTSLGLADAKETLAKLTSMGFFEDGLEALMRSPADLDFLERKMFGSHLALLNEQGMWVPMGKAISDAHFTGRLSAYFHVMVKVIGHNFNDFLGGGWAENLGQATEEG